MSDLLTTLVIIFQVAM